MTQDTQLPLAGDIIDFIKLNGQELEWLWRDGEAFIPVRPICEILGLSWQPQHRKLTGAESDACVTTMVTHDTINRRQEMLCIAYPDFMMWLGNISPSRVKPEARAAMNTTRREIKLLLASHYKSRLFGGMADLSHGLQKLKMEALKTRPSRGDVVMAVQFGWSFEQLWRSGSLSRPKWVILIKDCLALGLIDEAPKGTPFALGGVGREYSPNSVNLTELGINAQKEPHVNSDKLSELTIEALTGDLFDTERSPRP